MYSKIKKCKWLYFKDYNSLAHITAYQYSKVVICCEYVRVDITHEELLAKESSVRNKLKKSIKQLFLG